MGEMKTFDGVLLSIDQHAAMDRLREKLIEKGSKDLSDAYSDQMHFLFVNYNKELSPSVSLDMAISLVSLFKQMAIVLNKPLLKLKIDSPGIAMFSEQGQEIAVHPDGRKAIIPTPHVAFNPVKGFRRYNFEDGM